MTLHYDITQEDYIAFNLNYFDNNAVTQNTVRTTRIASVFLVLFGGLALMYFVKMLHPISILLYAALGIAMFFLTPRIMRNSVKKNTIRVLRRANNQKLCGPKTLTLNETGFILDGENEHTEYKYDIVERTASDAQHYYIFFNEFSAIIVPFSAFADQNQKQEFYRTITQCITDEALKL